MIVSHNPKGCWRECAAATLALFCTIGLNINAFSVHIPYLTEALQLTYTQNSNFILVRNLVTFGTMFFIKAYYEKLEVRLGFTLAVGLAAVSAFLYANAQSFPVLCIAAAISGLCNGLGGMYPAAILIHRWFPAHEGLAMGICAAGTGLAIIAGAPILTALTENYSMVFSLYCEIVFILICAVVCFVLIRNYPRGVLHHKIHHHAKRQPIRVNWMFLAVVAIGMMGGSFSFLTTHYATEGFDPYQISLIISVIGLVLTVAKFILGELFDLWGALRTNWLFLSTAILSCVLFSVGGLFGYIPALIAAVLFGIGDSIATVGLTVYAKDLSAPEDFATTQQQYQTASTLGGLAYTLIPGPVANITGNYRGFFAIITGLAVFATVVIQRTYMKKQCKILPDKNVTDTGE